MGGSESFRDSGVICSETDVYWALQRLGYGICSPGFDSRLAQDFYILLFLDFDVSSDVSVVMPDMWTRN